MITRELIAGYMGPALYKGKDILILAPHRRLLPFIANYTLTCPLEMNHGQMVMPTASTTLVFSAGRQGIVSGLRGINTKPVRIGAYASAFPLMLLVEFHPAGLFSFIQSDQRELLDGSFDFADLHQVINHQVAAVFENTDEISPLILCLDEIFHAHLIPDLVNPALDFAMKAIVRHHGMVRGRWLADEAGYSERQLNRIFQRCVGTGIKTFSRIVRMKYAAELLGGGQSAIIRLSERTGHYDPSHFVRDFREIYGVTPNEYRAGKELLYSDPYKLNMDWE